VDERRRGAQESAALTVAAMTAEPALGLRALTGQAGLSRLVLAAHTSELTDPTPWLHGGELLMTTGLALDTAPGALAAYVERLATVGVACLAVGTGPTLTFTSVPGALVDAAARHELSLLEVPEDTPFLAVTQTVFARLAAAQYAEQLRALEAQRILTAAAVHPGGLAAVASSLAAQTGLSVLVTDPGGQMLATAGRDAGLAEELVPELARLRPRGLGATASLLGPGRDVRVQPLGSSHLRGFLACGGVAAPGAFERQLMAGAVVLMSLELERLRGASNADRQERADVVRALLQRTVTDAAAAELLASVSLRASTVAVVVLPHRRSGRLEKSEPLPADHAEQAMDALAATVPALLAADLDGHAVALVLDPPPDLALLVDQATGGTAAGIGGRARPADAARAYLEGRWAARTAAAGAGGALDVATLASIRLLLSIDAVTPGAVASYADSVLGTLDSVGSRRETLLRSLRAFLESSGSWEETALELRVHRHTLRQRLRQVEELTGRRLASGRDRMELLLAFEARDLQAWTDANDPI